MSARLEIVNPFCFWRALFIKWEGVPEAVYSGGQRMFQVVRHRSDKLIFVVSGVLFLALVFAFAYSSRYFGYYIWADRDLYRGVNLMQEFQVFGVEFIMPMFGRIPGGAYYYMIWLFSLVSPDPQFIYWCFLTLALASTLLLVDLGRRIAGLSAGLLIADIFLSSQMVGLELSNFYNPFAGIPVLVAAYYALGRFVLERRAAWFLGSAAGFMLAGQFHITYLFPLIYLLPWAIMDSRGALSRRHAAWGLGLFVLVFLPWLLHVVFGLFPADVAEIVKSPKAASEAPAVPMGLLLMHRLKQFVLGLSLSDYGGLSLRANFPLVGVALTLVYLFAAKAAAPARGELTRRMVGLMLWVLTCETVVMTLYYSRTWAEISVGAYEHRYFIHAVPAVAIMVGLSVAALVREPPSSGRFAAVAVLVGWAAVAGIWVKSAFQVYAESKVALTEGAYRVGRGAQGGFQEVTYGLRTRIFADIRENFGISGDSLVGRVSLVRFDPDKKIWRYWDSSARYLAAIGQPAAADAYAGCVAVLSRETSDPGLFLPEGKVEEWVRLVKGEGIGRGLLGDGLSQVRRLAVDKVVVRDRYALVGYRSGENDCPKSLINGYILDPQEKLLEARFRGQRTAATAVERSPGGAVLLMANHPVSWSVHPWRFAVELTRAGGSVSAVLHSNKLSAFSSLAEGFWGPYKVHNPRVIFRDVATGKESQLVIHPGWIGVDGFRTPWRGPALALPPGIYDVSLAVENLGPKGEENDRFEIGGHNVVVPLAQALDLKE